LKNNRSTDFSANEKQTLISHAFQIKFEKGKRRDLSCSGLTSLFHTGLALSFPLSVI
jgi:hypothetical protein